MILVDSEIKELAHNGELISSGYEEDRVQAISYDMTVGCVIDKNGAEIDSYDLTPSETVFVKTYEELSIPLDIMGRIAEKNSRMRMGLKVDGPHYYPGHKTYAFLRVHNISEKTITVEKGDSIAQIIFEQLSKKPDVPYSEKANASFNEEKKYKGLGNYKDAYSEKIKESVRKEKEDLEIVSQKIYANVITLMGLLLSVFSLISINYDVYKNANLNFKHVIAINLSISYCILVLMGIILVFLNHAKNKKFLIAYILILVIVAVTGIILWSFI